MIVLLLESSCYRSDGVMEGLPENMTPLQTVSHQPEVRNISRSIAPISWSIAQACGRWVSPDEVFEILSNYAKCGFTLDRVAPVRPPSGSIYLFDRSIVRYFRKEGYNWRKKKDGKTVREAHERVKTGSGDVLRCRYAHGENDSGLQRRYYWIHDPALENIVLVHYRNDLDCRGEVSFSSLVDKIAVPGGVIQSSDLSDLDRSLSSRFSMSNRNSAVSVHSDCSLDVSGPSEWEMNDVTIKSEELHCEQPPIQASPSHSITWSHELLESSQRNQTVLKDQNLRGMGGGADGVENQGFPFGSPIPFAKDILEALSP